MTKVVTKKVPDGIYYLTENKFYYVEKTYDDNGYKYAFSIIDDDNDIIDCKFVGCPHLNGGSWEVIEDD